MEGTLNSFETDVSTFDLQMKNGVDDEEGWNPLWCSPKAPTAIPMGLCMSTDEPAPRIPLRKECIIFMEEKLPALNFHRQGDIR